MTARVVVWLTEGTWEAAVDAVAGTIGASSRASEVVLLYVIDTEISEALHGVFGGLMGRAVRGRDPGTAVESAAREAASGVLESAQRHLGRPAEPVVRVGRVEREVVAACEGAALLVCARDGDRSTLGPHSIGHRTRFVIDHAPCAVLLIWPDTVPDLSSLAHPRPAGHPPEPPH